MAEGLATANETSAGATLETVLPELDESLSHCVGTNFDSEGFFFSDRKTASYRLRLTAVGALAPVLS